MASPRQTDARPTDDNGLAPRRAAWQLLNGVTSEKRLLSELDGTLEKLAPEDRARAMRLAVATLRASGRADRILKPHLRKRPPEIVMNALRLGVVEAAGGAPAHGVVNACVSLVGDSARLKTFRGMVNAVLRKAVEIEPAEWDKLPVPNLPKWLRRPLSAAWGDRTVQRIEHAHFAGAPLDLTAKGDPAVLAEQVSGELLPTGSVRLSDYGQVSALPGYADGDWWVQDAAAAMPVRLLDPQPGERILDLCAAPGGKTLQLAAAGAEVTALDLSDSRLARVRENLDRCRMTANIVAADATTFEEDGWDAIVLDAPCSATGTIRRHPDLPFARDGSEYFQLFELQARLIDHAIGLLKPGGRLLYCTCSLLPDEGEAQLEEALERHPDLAVAPLPEAGWIEAEWHADGGGLRLRPDFWSERGGMDGFFAAVLTKPG
ncbi:RsmB/NOP family class I SAM-dependent RNA methyltransferase [Pelagovum pacificum]|uniref:RsmB/NOP family class I SAM-dependent RNA methyltransferase n=1 Tax=Pelagovum pacificum TaxID=2588711 RepID=A0A5C5GHX7_9RHOB|nr:RsmB/NOP family class I SAM-dependent RNA methyltransferase [Pelagovum pacificum]QQA43129.1 RsmB/NOP family class I SAM-dependent RNA methyltransferase [Pelagovum pacificum]TNY33727.1 RsmB/NOP family class I SAM-dependent RNA methyltransferase [Pelagovum pacificum]